LLTGGLARPPWADLRGGGLHTRGWRFRRPPFGVGEPVQRAPANEVITSAASVQDRRALIPTGCTRRCGESYVRRFTENTHFGGSALLNFNMSR
jgi:hypothetical protein